jgi:hypothetical protein
MPLFVFLMEQKDTEQQELGEKKEKEEKYALQFGSLPETVQRIAREEKYGKREEKTGGTVASTGGRTRRRREREESRNPT